MTLFDRIVMVDWSAASTPKLGKDSIWIGAARWRRGELELADPINPPTRREAEEQVAGLLEGWVPPRGVRMKGVQETWKLLGAGSVGNQALLRIPCVARLRERPNLAAFSRVWPFETGFSASSFPATGPFVLHAEIWPGAMRPDNELHPVRDAAQVLSLARCLAEADDPRRVDHRGGLDSRRVGVTPETYLHLVNQPPSGSVDHR